MATPALLWEFVSHQVLTWLPWTWSGVHAGLSWMFTWDLGAHLVTRDFGQVFTWLPQTWSGVYLLKYPHLVLCTHQPFPLRWCLHLQRLSEGVSKLHLKDCLPESGRRWNPSSSLPPLSPPPSPQDQFWTDVGRHSGYVSLCGGLCVCVCVCVCVCIC